MKKTGCLRVGIVGLGRAGWGMQCVELDSRTDRFALVAGCDLYHPWRERFAAKYPAARVTASLDEMLQDPGIDLISIATRSNDHFAHAMAALEAGKIVFLEKPMCMTYAEAQALQASSEKGPGKLFIRHNRRFEAGFTEVRRIIASGCLGDIAEIRLCRTGFGRRNDWQTLRGCGGGQLGNWGSHIIDHGLQFLGAPDRPLTGLHTHLACIAAVGDAEDHVKIVMTGQSGTVVDIDVSGGAAISSPTYLVWGTRGALEGWGDRLKLRYLDPAVELLPREAFDGVPGSEFVLPDGEVPLSARTIGSNYGKPEVLPWIEEERTVPPADPGMIWDALHDALFNNIPFPVTLDQAVETMRVIDIARQGESL